MLGAREELLVRRDRQVERVIILLGTSQRRSIIRDIRTRKIVRWEARRHLLPTGNALAGVGFGKRPQMPSCAIVRIGRDRPRRKLSNDFRSAAREPVRVCERNETPCIVGTVRNSPLKPRNRVGIIVQVQSLFVSIMIFELRKISLLRHSSGQSATLGLPFNKSLDKPDRRV